jgi:sugar O-acyltransferase (sialic acid O-acetyltransferase NeuD family)
MIDKRRVLIIGAGGHGKELCSYIHDIAMKAPTDLLGFIDDNKKAKTAWSSSVVMGDFAWLAEYLRLEIGISIGYITAVGNNLLRQEFIRKLDGIGAPNFSAWSLCHPASTIGQDVTIGEGSCLAPGSIVTAHSGIGRHSIVNVNASVSHDCDIGDFSNINPGAVICGNVRIGLGCYIGAGATVIDKISIGEWTVVGAGAVVTKDLPANVTAVGVPARVIKSNNT